MPPEPTGQSQFIDLSGPGSNDLSLLNSMQPTQRELRAIRILLGVIYNELCGKDIDISEFTALEALEG